MKYLIYICFICLISSADASADDATLVNRYIALAVTGDLRPAFALLAVDGARETDQALADRFRQRFVTGSESRSPNSGNALVDAAVSAYREYWAQALFAGTGKAAAQQALNEQLQRVLVEHAASLPGDAGRDANLLLGEALERQGFHALSEIAPPLQDLFIWTLQRTESFEVQLTDQVRTVSVAFMSGFHSLGWKEYAALGLATTTGWVEDGVLYCMEASYRPGTEAFEVSYLKHETRHLADFGQFPGLPAADLEYRAKLTELAFAVTTLRQLLRDFTAKRAPGTASPHGIANERVVQTIYAELYGRAFPGSAEAWEGVSADQVSRAAWRLLAEDTARHKKPARGGLFMSGVP